MEIAPEIAVIEEWDDPKGEYHDYDVTPSSFRNEFLTRKAHRTIRSMIGTPLPQVRNMLVFDGLRMGEMTGDGTRTSPTLLTSLTLLMLDPGGFTMEELESEGVFLAGESWINGTLSVWPSLGYRTVLNIAVSGPTMATSIELGRTGVDLVTGFKNTDHVSLALPAFPASALILGNCFLDFTSHPEGSFSSQKVSLAFTDSVTPLANEASEARWPLSALHATGFDPTSVTGVQLRLDSTTNTTVRVAAIRVLDSGFVATPLDIDTRYHRLVPSVSRIGDLTFDAPWPTTYRAAEIPGQEDPRPIDVSLMSAFNTGAMNLGGNEMTFYLRQRSEDYLTQLDLNGSFTQSDLDALHHQPDFARAMYDARSQSEMEEFSQTLLDSQNQWDLERTEDTESNAYIAVSLTWGPGASRVRIYDSETPLEAAYTFNFNLDASTDYLLHIDLEQNSIRVQIHYLSADGAILDVVFDSRRITDDFMFKRRKGRVGWHFDLEDGTAFIDNVRTSALMFAEYQSQPFRSLTAVTGIELFVSGTPDRQLVSGLNPGPYGGVVVPDTTRQNSTDGAFKIINPGTDPLQGVMTDQFTIDNWDETLIQFDVWFPKQALDANAGPVVFLLSDRGRVIQFPFPFIMADQWQTVRFPALAATEEQTGAFRLLILQTRANITTTWWLDNLSVVARSLTWSGRASDDAEWFDFKDSYNKAGDGIRLLERGFDTQVRGRALRQSAYIERIGFKPKYAELGNFVWREDAVTTAAPVAAFTHTSGNPMHFDGSGSSSESYLIDWTWNFGDDSNVARGVKISHTYAQPGSYTVTLTVTDASGARRSTSTVVSV
jgi:hypothetical protein